MKVTASPQQLFNKRSLHGPVKTDPVAIFMTDLKNRRTGLVNFYRKKTPSLPGCRLSATPKLTYPIIEFGKR
jgi:hypothetical protein